MDLDTDIDTTLVKEVAKPMIKKKKPAYNPPVVKKKKAVINPLSIYCPPAHQVPVSTSRLPSPILDFSKHRRHIPLLL
jgi:hypothetical protein